MELKPRVGIYPEGLGQTADTVAMRICRTRAGRMNARRILTVLAISGAVGAVATSALATPLHRWVGTTPKGVTFTFSSDGRRVTNFQAHLRWFCKDAKGADWIGAIKVGVGPFRIGSGGKVSTKQSFSTSEGSGTLSFQGALQNPRYKGYGTGRMGYTLTLSSGPYVGCTTSRPSIAWAAKDRTLLTKKK